MSKPKPCVYGKHDALIDLFLKDENYEVRADGKLYSKYSRQGHKTQTFRKVGASDHGYIKLNYRGVGLWAHRIVYRKFNGPLHPNLVINHLDGNKSNNVPTNLELVTMKENNLHKFRVLKNRPVLGNFVISFPIAQEIRKDRNSGMSYSKLVKKYSVSKSTIAYVIQNRIWKDPSLKPAA